MEGSVVDLRKSGTEALEVVSVEQRRNARLGAVSLPLLSVAEKASRILIRSRRPTRLGLILDFLLFLLSIKAQPLLGRGIVGISTTNAAEASLTSE